MYLKCRMQALLAAGMLGLILAGCQSQPSASSPNSPDKENQRIQQQALEKENAAQPGQQAPAAGTGR